MKIFFGTIVAIFFSLNFYAQTVGIGIENPNSNVVLQVQDPTFTRGMLVPFAFDTSIVTKVEGALIYYTGDDEFYFCNNGKWRRVGIDDHFDIFNNTYTGEDALSMVTIQSNNTAFGHQTLKNLNAGERNTAIGNNSQISNLSGNNNTSLGASSLYSNTSTSQNVGIGFQSLYHFTSGESGNIFPYNTALGANSMFNVVQGEHNTSVGGLSMVHYSDPGQVISGNTAIGYSALSGNVGSNNIAIGTNAGADINGNNPSSNSLFIDIDDLGENSLIYGRFNDNYLDFNGNVQIKDTLYLSNDGIKFSDNSKVTQSETVQYGIVATTSISFFGFIGEIRMIGKGVVFPTGLIPCDGRALSRTDYATLFGAIGTNYGAGDGSTTFNVPDFRKGIPVGE